MEAGNSNILIQQIRNSLYDGSSYNSTVQTQTDAASLIAPTNQIESDSFTTQNGEEKTQNPEKKEKKKIAYFSMAGATALVLGSILLHPRFLGSKTYKILHDFATYMSDILKEISPRLEAVLSKILKVPALVIGKFFNMCNNLATFKDIIAKTITDKIPPLKFFDKKTGELYKSMGVKTTSSAYQKAVSSYEKNDIKIKEILKESLKNPENLKKTVKIGHEEKSVQEWIGEIETLMAQRQATVNKIDADKTKRFEEVQKIMDGLDKEVRQKMTNSIKDFRFFRTFSKDFIAQEARETEKNIAIKNLENLKAQVSGKEGYNEKIATILKNITDEKTNNDFIKPLERQSEKALKRAISLEGNDFFDKVRDITNGSAQTDVFSILATMGLMGVYLGQADNAEERKHVTLTTGIPLMAAITTSMVASMKMIAGAKALIFAGITGLIANRVGTTVDGIYTHNLEDRKKKDEWIPTIDDLQKNIEKRIQGQVPETDFLKV